MNYASAEKPNFQHAESANSACLSAIMLAYQGVRKAGCTCIRSKQTPGPTFVLFH